MFLKSTKDIKKIRFTFHEKDPSKFTKVIDKETLIHLSTEAEYKAIANTTSEIIWLQSLLFELHLASKVTPKIWFDNIGAIYLTANSIFHARTKHVKIDFHFVRERVTTQQLFVSYISAEDQIADIFTKPLSKHRFNRLTSKLNVRDLPLNLSGSKSEIF